MVNSINNLPLDILFTIFDKIEDPYSLGQCEKVCKGWKKIIERNQTIWRKHLVEQDPNSAQIKPEELKEKLILQLKERKASQLKAENTKSPIAKVWHTTVELGSGITEYAKVIWEVCKNPSIIERPLS